MRGGRHRDRPSRVGPTKLPRKKGEHPGGSEDFGGWDAQAAFVVAQIAASRLTLSPTTCLIAGRQTERQSGSAAALNA